MAKNCSFGEVLTGVGTLLTGLAACAAVWIAKEPVTNYLNKISVTQTVVVNTCEAGKQADELIEKSADPATFDSVFAKIPAGLPKSSRPTGLFIAPEFRDAAKLQLESNASPDTKRAILKGYWEKSLSKETKAPVDLQFNGM